MRVCQFCGGDLDQPARPGCLAPVMHAAEASYMPPFEADSEAFDGVSDETLDAVLGKVTPEQIWALIKNLTAETQHADIVLRLMQDEPWWPNHAKLDTQRRRLRTIIAAANARGYPVCSTNAGYSLGDCEEVAASARRARRMADGANQRARVLERIARKMAKV